MATTTRPEALVRELQKPHRLDEVSRAFIGIVCGDPELDLRLSRLLILFGVDMPKTTGGFLHHVSDPHRLIS